MNTDFTAELVRIDAERAETAKKAAIQVEIQEVGKRQAAEQEALAAKFKTELAALAERHGHKTYEELEAWLYPKAKAKVGRKAAKTKKVAKSAAPGKERKKRVKITPQMRHEMRNDKTKGMKAADIAKKYGVSIGVVNKLKRTDE